MAIPSIMTPVKIDDHLLVDGGITNNFPVQQAKDFGADIIIGIDVGAPLYKEEELTSLFRIMEQATSFTNDEATKKARKMCNILITPDITGISSASFDIPHDIIDRGEIAARQQYDQLLKLSKQLEKYKTTTKKIKIPVLPDSFHISNIKIEGLKNVSKELITSKLNIKSGDIINRSTMENAITEVYSSRYFNRVIYRLKPDENGTGTTLILRVEEKTLDRFRFGLHYDTDLKSALLLNTTLRNVWINGSKLKFDARLSTNPELIFSYFYYTGKAPGFRIGTVLNYSQINVTDYNYESEKIANADLETAGAELQLQTLLNKSVAIILGAKLDFNLIEYITTKKNSTGTEEKYVIDENSGMTNFSATFLYNSLNKTVFPTNGVYANIRGEYIPIISNDLSALISGNESDMSLLIKNDFSRASFRYKQYVPIAKRLTVQANLRLGFTSSSRAPLSYLFFIGGLARESDSFVSFEGVHFLAIKARNFFVGGLTMQWEPFDKKYVIFSGKMGRSTTDKFTDIINIDSYYGYGISFGMDSFIGPIALAFSGGTDVQSVITYFTIGYNF
jgi:NTE family protein